MINLQKYYYTITITLKDQNTKIKIGFTVGDMNGVGPEILLTSLSDQRLLDLHTPVIYGPVQNLIFVSKKIGLKLSFNKIINASEAKSNLINVIDNYTEPASIRFGKLDKDVGLLAFRSIEKSVIDLKKNLIDVLVTAPINKEAIHSEEFSFMGHTDYIDSQVDGEAIMMMVSDELKVALLTEHIPISEVAKQISEDLVVKKIKELHKTLIRDFDVEKPKIAVLSIDPHAGDNGVIGSKDKTVLAPTIKALYDSGLLVFGPFPSDSFFGSGEYKKFDLIVASFHDQGLIPFKTLSFGMGVNYTSGLREIRTSPDHGTAYGIAGKGVANKDSFLSSIYLAVDIFKRRKVYDQLLQNKLVK